MLLLPPPPNIILQPVIVWGQALGKNRVYDRTSTNLSQKKSLRELFASMRGDQNMIKIGISLVASCVKI